MVKKSKKPKKKVVKKSKKPVKKTVKKKKKAVKKKVIKKAKTPTVKVSKGNLLVSFDPVHEESAKTEILGLLKEVGENGKIVSFSDGLAEISVRNPRKAITSLLEIAKTNIDQFRYTFNWWPVDVWCKSELLEMQKEIKKIQKGIKPEEKWKMDLIKRKLIRNYQGSLIVKLTDVVDKQKIDLNSPDKIIRVELDGERAGISLLTPNELLNVPRLRN